MTEELSTLQRHQAEGKTEDFSRNADVREVTGPAALTRAELSVQGMLVPLQSRGETTDFSTTAEHAMPFWS